ncbi:MAG: hypothetical protein ABI652_06035, partial [Acidobacteriota bacterium]
MLTRVAVAALLVIVGLAIPDAAAGGQTPDASPTSGPRMVADAPPPPLAPAVISRDDAGHATLRATRVAIPIRVDGRLDDEAYTSVPSMSDFLQIDPQNGQPATQRTEAWLFFDADNVYVSARC